VLDGDQLPPQKREHSPQFWPISMHSPQFWPLFIVAKQSPILATAEQLLKLKSSKFIQHIAGFSEKNGWL